jgi:hypothetical protein
MRNNCSLLFALQRKQCEVLALGGGPLTSVIAAAAGAAVVLFAWRLAK